jgi:hypothetical protein
LNLKLTFMLLKGCEKGAKLKIKVNREEGFVRADISLNKHEGYER